MLKLRAFGIWKSHVPWDDRWDTDGILFDLPSSGTVSASRRPPWAPESVIIANKHATGMSMFSELRRDPRLRDLLITQITTFIRVLSVLKNDIVLGQPASVTPDAAPPSLPPSIHTFVSDATGIPFESVLNLWDLVKEDIWAIHHSDTKLSTSEEELFRMHGWKLGLSEYSFGPVYQV
jgi:hypothetical protein